MPRKVKQLIKELEQAGLMNRGGKDSHRNLVHINVIKPITISGKLSENAKQYQEKAVNSAIKESQK